jgi:hypothetical protein
MHNSPALNSQSSKLGFGTTVSDGIKVAPDQTMDHAARRALSDRNLEGRSVIQAMVDFKTLFYFYLIAARTLC